MKEKVNENKKPMKEVKLEDYLTPEFINDPYLLMHVLNDLNKEPHILELEPYGSGELLWLEVHDTPEVRGIISRVISDLDTFVKLHEFDPDNTKELEITDVLYVQNNRLHGRIIGEGELLYCHKNKDFRFIDKYEH